VPLLSKGCPEIKKEVVQKIALAAKGINFETWQGRDHRWFFQELG
jgi:hypothetical protein